MDFTDVKYLFKHLFELNVPRKINNKSPEWYYFLHIPKTAGTSLRYSLFEQFPATQVYPNNVDYYFKDKAKFIKPAEFKAKHETILHPNIKLLIGHLGLTPLQINKAVPPKTFVFFREPINRTLSALNYNSYKGRHYDNLNLEEKIAMCKKYEGNLYARTLGFRPKKKNIEDAIEQLKKIDVIGITEYYKESIQLINKSFGWNLPYNVHRNSLQKKMVLSDDHLNQIKQFCEPDKVIYSAAKTIFLERCAQKNIVVKTNI